MKPKVLVDPHGYAQPEDLARLGEVVEVVEPTERLSEPAFIEALAGCAGVIRLGGRLPELTQAVFTGAPDLRIAGVSGDRLRALTWRPRGSAACWPWIPTISPRPRRWPSGIWP